MAGAPIPFRQILENRFSQIAAETEMLFADARERTRRELADQFNQAARRLFQADGAEEVSATLAAAAAGFASTALVFRIVDGAARSSKIDIPLASAAALAGAVQTRDPVVAAATPGEVSPALIDLLGHSAEDRAYIYPLVKDGSVPAILYACGAVQGPALELLAQVAAAAWPAPPPPPAPAAAAGLVTIVPVAAPAPEPVSPLERLDAAQQKIHLKAQRWARVRVAELRLKEGALVQSARRNRTLYESLREPIDAGREEFRKSFLGEQPGMVDYLHQELLHTLAHDDAELLGKDYPGPLV